MVNLERITVVTTNSSSSKSFSHLTRNLSLSGVLPNPSNSSTTPCHILESGRFLSLRLQVKPMNFFSTTAPINFSVVNDPACDASCCMTCIASFSRPLLNRSCKCMATRRASRECSVHASALKAKGVKFNSNSISGSVLIFLVCVPACVFEIVKSASGSVLTVTSASDSFIT